MTENEKRKVILFKLSLVATGCSITFESKQITSIKIRRLAIVFYKINYYTFLFSFESKFNFKETCVNINWRTLAAVAISERCSNISFVTFDTRFIYIHNNTWCTIVVGLLLFKPTIEINRIFSSSFHNLLLFFFSSHLWAFDCFAHS